MLDSHKIAVDCATLVSESVQLVTAKMEEFSPILNVRIFKQIAIFLREITNDNGFAKCLYSE